MLATKPLHVLSAWILMCMVTAVQADDNQAVLFDFSKADAARQWQTVNDGVMGGVSDGCFKITDDETMEFFGTLSLENNGGFASVRSRPTKVNLKAGDSVTARVRGDGREYSLNLYVPRESGRYSFRQTFKTRKDEWIEVGFPVDKFVATWRGRVFPDQKLDPSNVNSVGFLLADKKTGPFSLEIDWIKVHNGSEEKALTRGFDANKVRPPNADKGKPIARLFYDYIYPTDIGVASLKLGNDEARQLTGKIFGELRRRCMDDHKITATPEEIQQFVAAMNRLSPATDDVTYERRNEDQRGFEAIGEQMVKGWKLDQMLYKKYGGTVIFQQGNPLEPVGAYREFLKEMETTKVFEVYDPDNRQKFWHYFVRQHPFQVPLDKIDFDKPWWMQKDSTAQAQIPTKGLILDLNADKGVEVEDGDRVVKWTNQVTSFPAKEFLKRDEGRKEAGSGRPTLKKSVAAIGGHNTLVFRRQELVNHDEDAFDHLLTGSGYTWLAVLSVYEQVVQLKDVNSFFGNLRNGGMYEGIWGNVTDDNRIWIGSRNGITFGRWDGNNPMVASPKPLEQGRYYVVAGRMGAGIGEVQIELFINESQAAASKPFPVNPHANLSKLAIGQERDATNHPGKESFDGELARFLVYEHPLTDDELRQVMVSLKKTYAVP